MLQHSIHHDKSKQFPSFKLFNPICQILIVLLLNPFLSLAAVAPNSPQMIKKFDMSRIDNSYEKRETKYENNKKDMVEDETVFLTLQDFFDFVPIGEGEGARIFKELEDFDIKKDQDNVDKVIRWDAKHKYTFPYKDLTVEEADYFRPKFISLLEGTWFLNLNLQRFISPGGGLNKVITELDILISLWFSDCMRNEVYQIPGDSSSSSTLKMKYGVPTEYHPENVNVSKSIDSFFIKSKLKGFKLRKGSQGMSLRKLRKTFFMQHSQTYNLFNHSNSPYVRYEISFGYIGYTPETTTWTMDLWVSGFGYKGMDIEEWKAVQKCSSDMKSVFFQDPMKSEWKAQVKF